MKKNNWIYLASVFLIASTLEVRVKAKNIDLPASCSTGSGSCAILFKERRLNSIELYKGTVKATDGSSLIKINENQVRIIRGEFYVEANDPEIVIQSLYGEVRVKNGAALLLADNQKIEFYSLKGVVTYQPRGENLVHTLPVGLTTNFSYITSQGVAQTAFPRLAVVKKLVENWSPFYLRSEKEQFKADMRKYMESWSHFSSEVGPWYQEVVEREIASLQAEREREARLKAQEDAENSKMRSLFRERIFEP